MLVPVTEIIPNSVSRVYVNGIFCAVVFPLIPFSEWRCMDVYTGEFASGSTRADAVDIYFKSKFRSVV